MYMYMFMCINMHAQLLSHVQLFETPCQTPLFMTFFNQGYWSGLPLSTPINIHTCTHTHTNIYVCTYICLKFKWLKLQQ